MIAGIGAAQVAVPEKRFEFIPGAFDGIGDERLKLLVLAYGQHPVSSRFGSGIWGFGGFWILVGYNFTFWIEP